MGLVLVGRLVRSTITGPWQARKSDRVLRARGSRWVCVRVSFGLWRGLWKPHALLTGAWWCLWDWYLVTGVHCWLGLVACLAKGAW